MSNKQLLVIDPQVDFVSPTGALSVKGADQDMKKASRFLTKMGTNIDDVHVTLDSHQEVHIAHPIFWKNSKGENPGIFTIISANDVKEGKWFVADPGLVQWGIDYVTKLEANARYPLCIWPPHCIIGSAGHAVSPDFSDALREWQRKTWKNVDFQVKGSNALTEHYSVFRADVPVDSDPSTLLNTSLVSPLREADEIYVMGEALSHCVKFSMLDLLSEIGFDYAKKFTFLEDCSSSVPGFEVQGEQFVKDMKKIGMNFVKSTDI